MRAALAAHDEVLRTAIEAHGGFVFKHTGDGVCAAFASPRSAVDAVIPAQRAEATGNPYALAYALSAYGYAFRDTDPHRAMEARRRGLKIAQDSGNRTVETMLATGLSSFEAK